MKLSICIPTYNRPYYLENCLNSIVIAKKEKKIKFEVCVSDNGSKHNIHKIVNKFKKKLDIKFHKFNRNMGISVNFLKVIKMAKGEFVWMIGSDDMLTPDAFKYLDYIYRNNRGIDFVFVNSYTLHKNKLDKFTHPFNTKKLPRGLPKFSNLTKNKNCNFWDLVDPKIAWDFMLGMFVLMFNREKFCKNLDAFDSRKIKDKNWMSNTDNTFFYLKTCAKAFKNSKAFFCAKPLSVNLQGVREWTSVYYLVEIIRIPEILDYYRTQGLNFFRYIYCKNYALRNFFNYMIKIFILKKKARYQYVSFKRHIFNNLLYPNVYLSLIYFILRRLRKTIA